jgi:hypothetical protein
VHELMERCPEIAARADKPGGQVIAGHERVLCPAGADRESLQMGLAVLREDGELARHLLPPDGRV